MHLAYQYIKRLLVFVLCLGLLSISIPFLRLYFSIPTLLLAFSILHSRITGERPPHLFAFYRTDAYFRKGGLRDLIRIFVTLFGFIYDTIIWTVWGIYLIFILFIDLLDLIKSIFYWIIHAIIWILRQYVPFVIFLWRIFIHYLIRWPWWLYQIAYYNIRYAFNRNSYRVALQGTLEASFIIFIFYFLEIMLADIPGITYIGIVIALLPITWSFGEIAAIRVQKLENEPYRTIRPIFQNGIESVRSILFYITLFIVLLLAQLGLNLLGWIPNSGIIIAGFMFNINTLISLFLLFLCILIVFGVMIIPSYRLFKPFTEVRPAHSFELLKVIGKKFLQFLIVLLPTCLFSTLILILPSVVIILVGTVTYTLKNSITEVKIDRLKTEQASSAKGDSAYIIGKKIEQLQNLKQFPLYISQEIEHRFILAKEVIFAQEDLRSINEELLKDTEESNRKIDNLNKEIEQRSSQNPSDDLIEKLKEEKNHIQNDFTSMQQSKKTEISKLKVDIASLAQKRNQIPFLFFFGGLWLVLFGGIAFAFCIAYMGNVFHQIFLFRNDDTPSEWSQAISDIRSADYKQPLLGGTLFIVSAVLIYLLITRINMIAPVIMLLSSFFSHLN